MILPVVTLKLTELRNLLPDALIIHLSRRPKAFVSSHMTPSYKEKGLRGLLARNYRKATFFSRKNRYNFYHYEQIIEEFYPEMFIDLSAAQEALENKTLEEIPAYLKLLLLYQLNQNKIAEFKSTRPENFLEWKFEQFLSDPGAHLQQIYHHFGEKMPVYDFSHLRKPNLGYKIDSPAWNVI